MIWVYPLYQASHPNGIKSWLPWLPSQLPSLIMPLCRLALAVCLLWPFPGHLPSIQGCSSIQPAVAVGCDGCSYSHSIHRYHGVCLMPCVPHCVQDMCATSTWSGCSIRIRLWPRPPHGCHRLLSIVPSGWGGGGGGWHKASVSDCLPLAAPIGLSPLHTLNLCGSERVLVVSTEPPDDLSCLTTPGVGRPGDGLLPMPLTRGIPMHTPSPCGGLPTPALTCAHWGVHLRDNFPDRGFQQPQRFFPVFPFHPGGGGGDVPQRLRE